VISVVREEVELEDEEEAEREEEMNRLSPSMPSPVTTNTNGEDTTKKEAVDRFNVRPRSSWFGISKSNDRGLNLNNSSNIDINNHEQNNRHLLKRSPSSPELWEANHSVGVGGSFDGDILSKGIPQGRLKDILAEQQHTEAREDDEYSSPKACGCGSLFFSTG